MKNLIARVANRVLSDGSGVDHGDLAISSEEESILHKSENPGPIEKIFYEHKGRTALKWLHYLPIYDRIFSSFRGKPISMLEIGVAHGGSMEMWRNYFGGEATIFGIDINPECAAFVDPPNQVRIGSQADPDFLRRVVAEMGAPDVILDDGSHIATHQRISFETLWPLLKIGGIYIIEDMHTAYYPWMEGGYKRRGTAIELVKTLIDDQHGWHHSRKNVLVPRNEIGGITIYDSMVIIEKVDRLRPGHFRAGGSK